MRGNSASARKEYDIDDHTCLHLLHLYVVAGCTLEIQIYYQRSLFFALSDSIVEHVPRDMEVPNPMLAPLTDHAFFPPVPYSRLHVWRTLCPRKLLYSIPAVFNTTRTVRTLWSVLLGAPRTLCGDRAVRGRWKTLHSVLLGAKTPVQKSTRLIPTRNIVQWT